MDVPQQEILRIGLTGGIASGKSLVAEIFGELGVPIIDTDEIARQIVAPGQPALTEIVAEFGADVLTPAGDLDRPSLRRLVFENDSQRRRLEAIVHPRIREASLRASSALLIIGQMMPSMPASSSFMMIAGSSHGTRAKGTVGLPFMAWSIETAVW
jgi:hypothetical protein